MVSSASYRRTVIAIAATTLVAVTAIWGAALWLADQDGRAVQRDARAELLGAQNTISAQITRTFENARFLLTVVDLWLGESSDTTRTRTIDDLAWWVSAIERNQQQDALQVRLYDESGDMVRFGAYGTEGISVGDREYIRALERRLPGFQHVGTQIVSRLNGRAAIPFAMRVRPNRFGVAYAVIAIDVQPIIDSFDGLLITAPGHVGIVRADGTLLLRTPDPDQMTGRRIDIEKLIDTAPEAPPTGLVEHRIFQESRRLLSAYARLNTLPLYSYASFNIDDLDAKAADRARPKLVAALLASIATVCGALLLAYVIGQREREAQRVADALAAADEANNAKTQFLANISHELRTPLNAVIGFSETMTAEMFGPLAPKYREYAADILASGRHLLSVVDQLLDMASIEARREHLRPETVTVDEIVDQVAHMMHPIASQRGVALALGDSREPIVIESDSRCVRQILINLMSNAVRFCRPGGRVALSWQRDRNHVLVVVEDQGAGIPEANLPRIFDLFWQGEDAYTRRNGGIGLGLPLTKTLVTALGGSIAVESRIDVGSRFTVRLPDALSA